MSRARSTSVLLPFPEARTTPSVSAAQSRVPAAAPSRVSRPFAAGLRASLGAATALMGVGFVAFGATAADLGLDPWWAVAASLLIYGTPGQVILAGGMAGGQIGVGDALAPTVANARFLPMSAALGAVLTELNPGLRRVRPNHAARLIAVAPFIAATAWTETMARCSDLPERERTAWFAGFGLASWLAAAAFTALGVFIGSALPAEVRPVLLFVTPLYFALLLGSDALGKASARCAIVVGALTGPLALALPPSWGALVVGVGAGTAAWAIGWIRR